MWPHRAMLMRSANGTRYRCYLPVEEGGDEGGSGAAGSSSAAAGSVAKVRTQQGLRASIGQQPVRFAQAALLLLPPRRHCPPTLPLPRLPSQQQGAQATQGSLSQKRKPTDLLEALGARAGVQGQGWQCAVAGGGGDAGATRQHAWQTRRPAPYRLLSQPTRPATFPCYCCTS